MISSLHGLYDDRIYWKEALSLRDHGYEVIHVAVGKEERDFISSEKIRLIQIRKTSYLNNPYLDILYRRLTCRSDITRKILRKCRQLKADVYHFHDQQINKIGRQLKKLPQRPKVIYDVHEDYYEQALTYNPLPWLTAPVSVYAACIRRREIKMSRIYDAVIAAVPHIAGNFRKYVDHSRLHVLYNYTTLKPVHFPDDDQKLYDAIYAGLMNKTRGGIEMIEAAAIVRKKLPAFKMLIVGPVSEKNYRLGMIERIENLCLRDHVILNNPVAYSEMESLFLQSRIGLGIFRPARIFHFGIQVKTFEYMACGLPIVCSNSGTINEFVSENKCGIPVDPASPQEIAEAIIKILTDKKLMQTFSNNGKKAAKEKYSWATEEKKLIDIYQTILNDVH